MGVCHPAEKHWVWGTTIMKGGSRGLSRKAAQPSPPRDTLALYPGQKTGLHRPGGIRWQPRLLCKCPWKPSVRCADQPWRIACWWDLKRTMCPEAWPTRVWVPPWEAGTLTAWDRAVLSGVGVPVERGEKPQGPRKPCFLEQLFRVQTGIYLENVLVLWRKRHKCMEIYWIEIQSLGIDPKGIIWNHWEKFT